MRFSVSYTNTARVECFQSSGELIAATPSEAPHPSPKLGPQSRAAVSVSEAERQALPFASLLPLDCERSVNSLSSTRSPAVDVSPCIGCVPSSDSVARWQQAERDYLSDSQLSEQRVIILIQESYRATLARLKTAHQAGCVSNEEAVELRKLIEKATGAVKAEFRRTVQRCRDQKAAACDVACLATKAVNCLASVYPWSSAGFVLPFSENNFFQSVATSPASSSGNSPIVKATSPTSVQFAEAPPSQASAAAAAAPSLPTEVSAPIARAPPAPAKPPRALQRLPAKKQNFEHVTLDDQSVATREVVAPPSPLQPRRLQVPGSPLPGAMAPNAPACPAEALCQEANAPSTASVLLPPAETNPGLIRTEERRYFERNQLTFGNTAFCVRSLASMSFVGYRRSAIAVWEAKHRMCASPASAPASADSLNASLGNSFFSSTGDDVSCPSAKIPYLGIHASKGQRDFDVGRIHLVS